MAAPHQPVEITSGDVYVHEFHLEDDEGAPLDLTGQEFSIKLTDGWRGAEITGVSATADVTDAQGGVVRVTVLAADTPILLDAAQPIARLRNDTLQTTILAYEIKEDT